MGLYFAPLEGVTTYLFRTAHCRAFGGCDKYFTPFFSPAAEHCLTPRERRDLCPEHNAGVPTVPQVMTRRAEDFLWAAEQMRDMGYGEVNLNLGCPSGTVTAKGKGAGFLARPEELDAFLDAVFSRAALPVSVKTRLGVEDAEEFSRLLEIYNRYPISELIIHPRVRTDFYKGPLKLDAFADALAESKNPVVYNGDLVTAADCAALHRRFPRTDRVMIGRGAVADPALPRKLRGGTGAAKEEILAFVRALYRDYREALGNPPAAQRMKELWYYLLHLFRGGEQYARQMRRLRSPGDYERLEFEIFQNLELLPEAQGAFQ